MIANRIFDLKYVLFGQKKFSSTSGDIYNANKYHIELCKWLDYSPEFNSVELILKTRIHNAI
jgi:hypothetical protein